MVGQTAARPMPQRSSMMRGLSSIVRPGLSTLPWLTRSPQLQSYTPLPASWRFLQPARHATRVAAAATTDAAEDDERIIETELRQEAEQSYLSYAMSVIVGRALPDARDGLKSVHRRILYAMHELGLSPSKPFRKCARVVGEVLGKFHPHGDTAVYDALVRMAQDFSMRATLIDGHGNFGSLDDDPAAAMRYTECRLKPIAAAALLADLDAGTVPFLPNFDASTDEPAVLPAKVPNLLINGSSGIAVGIATKIPPHNMREVVSGLKALIQNPNITVKELMRHIPAPDFPTGGVIIANDGLEDAYHHGRGTVLVRAKVHVEDMSKKKPLIVITELPYQTNKAALVEQIAKFVDEGKITGVADIRDESDRSGMRVVVELKRGTLPELTMNQLLKHTTLQTRFSCNMIGLVDGVPKTLSLKDFLKTFLDFRCEVVVLRAKHELKKASTRLHLVEGFLIAMKNMNEVVNIIRTADDGDDAVFKLKSSFGLSDEQADGVMGLTLRRLTSLEGQKLEDEQKTLLAKIEDLEDLLAKKERVLQVVEAEAKEIAEKHGDDRRTELVRDEGQAELRELDVIPNSSSIIVYSRKGFIKRMNVDTFTVQGIRGTGKAGARLKEEDALEEVIHVNDHDTLLFFTTNGQVHSLTAYQVPEASRTATGTAITQILRIKPSELAVMLPVTSFEGDIVLLTSNGQIKRMAISQFSKINSAGIRAMTLKDGDELKFVSACAETDTVLLSSSRGMTIHFSIGQLRQMTRVGMGIRAMNLGDAHFVGMSILPKGSAPEASGEESSGEEEIGASGEADMNAEEDDGAEDEASKDVSSSGPWLFTLTKKGGLGKRVSVDQFPVAKGRTGKGLKTLRLGNDDSLAAAVVVGTTDQKEDLLISTKNGMLLRIPVDQISPMSRAAKGSRIVKLKEGDEVVGVTRIASSS